METIFISSKIITLSSPLLVMQRGCMFINEIIVELWSNLRQRNMDNGPWHQPHWQPQEDPCYRCETIATAACWQCPNVMCSRHSFGYDGVHLRCGACHLRSIPADEEEEVSEQSESNDEPENENNHDDYEGEEEEVSEQSQSSDEPEGENNHDSDEGSLPMSFPEPSFEDPPAPHEPDDPERTSMANTPESTTIIDRPVSGHCAMNRAIYRWDRLVWLICHRRFGVDLSVMASASWIRELEFFSNWSSESSLEEVALPDGRIQLFRAP